MSKAKGWMDSYSPQIRHFILLAIAALIGVGGFIVNQHVLDNVIPQSWAWVIPVFGSALTYAAAWFTKLTGQYGVGSHTTVEQEQAVEDVAAQVAEKAVNTVKKTTAKKTTTPKN